MLMGRGREQGCGSPYRPWPAYIHYAPHTSSCCSRVAVRHCLMDHINVPYYIVDTRDENGTDIFRPYSRPNPFRGVLIRPYPSPDI
jgi:hypothetical protein